MNVTTKSVEAVLSTPQQEATATSTNKLVLVFNCGSSSIKFALVAPANATTIVSGLVQRIGSATADLEVKYAATATAKTKQHKSLPHVTYHSALQTIIDELRNLDDLYVRIGAVGHRVVHGGEAFTTSVLITEKVLNTIRDCAHLAPLHNPANITGIEEARSVLPQLPHVAVFDTAFHQTMSPHAFIYPIPYAYYTQYQVRRYGFHGTSHRFVSAAAAHQLQVDVAKSAFITAHLGNGCSAAAILNGRSIDTTMGFTPLEGLMMGTRCGDIDPSLHAYLANNLNLDVHKITEILNKQSGLLGVSGSYSDMREIEAAATRGEMQATLALEIFCYRLAKYIGALAVPLGRIDALIFTGGIGENSVEVRAKTLSWLQILGYKIDATRNAAHGKSSRGIITVDESTVAMVVPTNEELLIAQDTAAITTIAE